MKKKIRLAALLLTALFALVSCGKNGGESSGSGESYGESAKEFAKETMPEYINAPAENPFIVGMWVGIPEYKTILDENDFVVLTRLAGRLSRDPSFLNPFAAGHYGNAGMELLGRAAGSALAKVALGEKDVADEETVKDLF